jgi:DNA mismatch repair protein MutS2
MSIGSFDQALENLDLTVHVKSFQNFFAREKSIIMQGDREHHFRYIKALDELTFNAPPKLLSLETLKAHLSKQGVVGFEQIFELLKVIRYFRTLKNLEYSGLIGAWLEKIVIPDDVHEVDTFFDEKGNFNEYKDDDVQRITSNIKATKESISSTMKQLIYSSKLKSYLVDTQIHYINDDETLMLRGGFNHALKGNVVGRSSGGFFYVLPDAILKQKQHLRDLQTQKEALFYEYAKQFSKTLTKFQSFIKYIDKEFDKFDHYQARVQFARSFDYALINPDKSSDIRLVEFNHPALHDPKSITIDFTKSVLMITGVNAGGKTMLLKSILSATLMAKYLIPMSINATKSKIGSFKKIEAIIDDPQSVKNDISTFAGRMIEFSKIFDLQSSLIGVDEIELGTDSDEAAALFKIMLDELVQKNHKIVVTTHHKRLASLMADRNDVEMMAALFDEEKRAPTYEFLQGVIGKSYAFETALRYGISRPIVQKAKEQYGQNYEQLSELIERGTTLQRELKLKHDELDKRLDELKSEEEKIKELKAKIIADMQDEKSKLQKSYHDAIKEAKSAASMSDKAQIHKKLNEAKKYLPPKEALHVKQEIKFAVGDIVKYKRAKGEIISLKQKEAIVEVEGMRVRVKLHELKKSSQEMPKQKVHIKQDVEKKSGLTLDLHGLRAEESREKMDKFLSDALLSGFDEVVIYHGIGTGKLAYAVKEFLKEHPSVVSFHDAPPQLGGFGAKVVQL